MQKLSPKSVWIFFVRNFLFILFLELLFCIPLLNVFIESDINIVFIILILIIANIFLSYIIAFLTYRYFSFEITDSKIFIQKGIILKIYSNIPYARIQNIEINRGILDRILGLSTIIIQTAGISGVPVAEGTIPEIEKERAENLIKEIEIKQQSSNQGGT